MKIAIVKLSALVILFTQWLFCSLLKNIIKKFRLIGIVDETLKGFMEYQSYISIKFIPVDLKKAKQKNHYISF